MLNGCEWGNRQDQAHTALCRTLERELAAEKADCDLNRTRLASIFWSGAMDKFTGGDVQKWTEDYTAELTRLRAQLAAIEEDGTEEHNAAVGLRQKLVAALDRAEKAEAALHWLEKRGPWDSWDAPGEAGVTLTTSDIRANIDAAMKGTP
jgi:hypothetical protein